MAVANRSFDTPHELLVAQEALFEIRVDEKTFYVGRAFPTLELAAKLRVWIEMARVGNASDFAFVSMSFEPDDVVALRRGEKGGWRLFSRSQLYSEDREFDLEQIDAAAQRFERALVSELSAPQLTQMTNYLDVMWNRVTGIVPDAAEQLSPPDLYL